MKVALLSALVLGAVVAVFSSASYEKVNMGSAWVSGMSPHGFMGRQDDNCTNCTNCTDFCNGLCIIHYSEPNGCGLGIVNCTCEDDFESIGKFDDGCNCCIRKPEVEE